MDFKSLLQCKKIYSRLGDDLSKKIYRKKVELFLGNIGRWDFAADIAVDDFDRLWKFDRWYELFGNDAPIVVCGAGNAGKATLKAIFSSKYRNKDIYVCDQNAKAAAELFRIAGKDKLHKLSFEQAVGISGAVYVICTVIPEWCIEIYRTLLGLGINPEKIFIPHQGFLLGIFDRQYFDLFLPIDEEVFVDCGCWDASTSFQFSKWCRKKYQKIVAFEPDYKNYEVCMNNIKKWGLDQVELIQAACYCENGEIMFCEEASASWHSRISREGNRKVPVNTIDSALNGEKATFIKMDLEGGEYNALLGAKNTIQRYSPTLAISVYHKPDDIFVFPVKILEMNEGYTLYLRHYSNIWEETVLYAVPEGRQLIK